MTEIVENLELINSLKQIPDFADLPEQIQKQIAKTAIFSNYVDDIKALAKVCRSPAHPSPGNLRSPPPRRSGLSAPVLPLLPPLSGDFWN